jgi:hypothetical protein
MHFAVLPPEAPADRDQGRACQGGTGRRREARRSPDRARRLAEAASRIRGLDRRRAGEDPRSASSDRCQPGGVQCRTPAVHATKVEALRADREQLERSRSALESKLAELERTHWTLAQTPPDEGELRRGRSRRYRFDHAARAGDPLRRCVAPSAVPSVEVHSPGGSSGMASGRSQAHPDGGRHSRRSTQRDSDIRGYRRHWRGPCWPIGAVA